MQKSLAMPTAVMAPGVAAGSAGGIGSGSGGGTGAALYRAAPPSPPPASPVKNLPEIAQPSPRPDAKPASERALLDSKLSPAVLARFDCWKKQQSNCKLSPDGTLRIQLFLTDNSPAVIDQLKALGLQITEVRKKEKAILGRLPIEKLTVLAKLETVTFVTQVSR
jgi:hypothetical protein